MNLQSPPSETLSKTLNTHLSDKLTLEALCSFELALVVLDRTTATVVFLSDGFQKILPAMQIGDQFADQSVLVSDNGTDLIKQAIVGAELTDASHQTSLNGCRYTVRIKSLSSGYCLISLSPSASAADNLHDYMHARDTLFATSKTISVSEMATTLAHEINTPIGTISNILSGIKLRLQKPETSIPMLNEALNKALEQTRHTQSVIDRIRDFTRQRRPKLEVLDIRDQIREAVSLMDWLIGKNHCDIKLILPKKPVFVVGDATMLQQVLINLIRNAIDAMSGKQADQRKIQIHLEQLRGFATVSIADSGTGLGAATDELFVPFVTKKETGMGVGLNICRSFVELHQGKLWLADNDMKGCTSYVELPLAEPELNVLQESAVDA